MAQRQSKERPKGKAADRGRTKSPTAQPDPRSRYTNQPSQSTGTGGGGTAGPVRERSAIEKAGRGGVPSGTAKKLPTGSSGVGSGLQSGGTRPAGGRFGGFGSIGTGGGSTGPGGGTAGATKRPKSK